VLFRAAAELMPRIPSLHVLIVGDGDLRPSLERLAQTLGIAPRVRFAGFRRDIPAVLQAMDVAVLPSRFEGMGRAVIEAQAAGCPVVASRVGGIPDVIEHERTGLLVPPGDAAALAQAVERLHRDGALRERLRRAAQQAVDERFDAKTMVRQIIDVYDALLTRRNGRAA
jgi:glycosyltransferase involved in cell wall biosynthesis